MPSSVSSGPGTGAADWPTGVDIRPDRARLAVSLAETAVALAERLINARDVPVRDAVTDVADRQNRWLAHAKRMLERAQRALENGHFARAVHFAQHAHWSALKAVILPGGITEAELEAMIKVAEELYGQAEAALGDAPSELELRLFQRAGRLIELGKTRIEEGHKRGVAPGVAWGGHLRLVTGLIDRSGAPPDPVASQPVCWGMMSPVERTDAQVVRDVLSGDRDAYRLLVRRYADALHGHALRMTRNPDEAADLVQRALVKGYKKLPGCRDPERVGAWLFRILANLCKDHVRSPRRSDVAMETVAGALRSRANPESDAEYAEIRDRVWGALDALTPEQREAFVLKHVEGRTYEEIAAVMDLSVASLKMRVHRAREALRGLLEEYA